MLVENNPKLTLRNRLFASIQSFLGVVTRDGHQRLQVVVPHP